MITYLPSITCGAFTTVIQTTLRWKYSVSPVRFFRVRQSGQDFFVLLNKQFHSVNSGYHISSNGSFTEYTVLFDCLYIKKL